MFRIPWGKGGGVWMSQNSPLNILGYSGTQRRVLAKSDFYERTH